MSPFFETVKIHNRTIHNRLWHNRRLNRTVSDNFGIHTDFDIAEFITLPDDDALYRCRILYEREIRSVTLSPYRRRNYRALRLVEADIEYPYKSTDRSAIDACFAQRGDADDIIIVREGLLTDTSIANIALYDGLTWYTPQTPLLEGTMRASLLAEKSVKTRHLTPDDLKKSVRFALMNAMTGFYQLKNIIFI